MKPMKIRFDLIMPMPNPEEKEFDVDREDYEECEHCGQCHDPDDSCPDTEMMRTSPIPELVRGELGRIKKKSKKKDK